MDLDGREGPAIGLVPQAPDLAHAGGLPALPAVSPEQLAECIRLFGLRPLIDQPQVPCEVYEILQARVPTVRHIPQGAQMAVSQALAGIVQAYCTHKSVPALWQLVAFAKLVLRPAPGKGKPSAEDMALLIRHRIGRLLKGDLMALWVETCAQYPQGSERRRTSSNSHRRTDPNKAGPLTQQQLDRVRQLLSDGAAKKALQLLNSAGVHDPSDPMVLARLQELHPPPHVLLSRNWCP